VRYRPRVATAVRWTGGGLLGLLGLFHLQFSVPNFLFAGECAGGGGGWLSCTVLYEALLSLAAGAALLLAARLLLSGRAVAAFAVAVAGTLPLTAFFWLVAVPTGLSDAVFGVMSLPVPVGSSLALVASLLVARRRAGRARLAQGTTAPARHLAGDTARRRAR
jgi:hypothetical protein